MAENGSSNTAIVAIVAVLVAAIALFYFFGGAHKDGNTITEKRNVNIEHNTDNSNQPSNNTRNTR